MSDIDRARDLVEFANDVDHALTILGRYPSGQARDRAIARLHEARAVGDELISGGTPVETAGMSSRMS